MLDTNIDKLFPIEVVLPDNKDVLPKGLLLRACKVYILDQNRIYSDFEDQTFDMLNYNNGYGAIDIEFALDNNIVREGYPKFYTKCFVIRTDTGFFIKPMKFRNTPSCSKINQRGELVIGIRYYFRDDSEIEKIINCKSFLVEGFIALGKCTNVFGIMCQLIRRKNNWEITSAYTYKPQGAKNIKYLID